METCWRRLERVVTLQAVHHRPHVLGQSLNSSGPAGGRRSRVCWRKQKRSVWGRLHEAVNWTVAMLLDLLQTVLNKTFTPFYTNLQSSRNPSHVIASVGRFESLRKNFLSDPDGCSMLVDLKILLWETNSTAGCCCLFFVFFGGGVFRGQMLPNIFQFCPSIWKHLMLPWSKTQPFIWLFLWGGCKLICIIFLNQVKLDAFLPLNGNNRCECFISQDFLFSCHRRHRSASCFIRPTVKPQCW